MRELEASRIDVGGVRHRGEVGEGTFYVFFLVLLKAHRLHVVGWTEV
jgi:hypothetical protein